MITLIVACSENGVIGRDGGMPWHLPAELARFKAATMGKPLLMGRKTYTSIGRPLPGRRMIVITRDPGFSAPGVEAAHSIEEALARVSDVEEVMIGGGASLYEALIARADRLLLTVVHATIDGDTRFPAFALDAWRVHAALPCDADARNAFAYTQYDLRRAGAGAEGPVPRALRRGESKT
jgi:dihydrofolate reductase